MKKSGIVNILFLKNGSSDEKVNRMKKKKQQKWRNTASILIFLFAGFETILHLKFRIIPSPSQAC